MTNPNAHQPTGHYRLTVAHGHRQVHPYAADRREAMLVAGHLIEATESRLAAPRPRPNPGGPSLSSILNEMRDAETY
jgi:hypothetical protein